MVYLISHGLEYVKIGFTDNIKQRISHLQGFTPVKLNLLRLVKGSYDDEQNIHAKFKQHHRNGEWYYVHQDILNYFDSLEDLKWRHGFTDSEKIDIIGAIKTERLNQNLSLTELSEKINMTPQALTELEKREMQGGISLNSMRKIAGGLGKKFEYRLV